MRLEGGQGAGGLCMSDGGRALQGLGVPRPPPATADALPAPVRLRRETPLLLAARRGHAEAVELLLAHGATPNKAGGAGVTPLMAASLFGHLQAARALLARGAGTAARDATHKRTPLHLAALADAEALASLLLQHGADASAVDAAGATPMDLAVEYECTTVVHIFTTRG